MISAADQGVHATVEVMVQVSNESWIQCWLFWARNNEVDHLLRLVIVVMLDLRGSAVDQGMLSGN